MSFIGVVACVVVMMVLLFLTPVLKFMPLSVLAVVIISNVIPLIDLSVPKEIYKINRINLIPYIVSLCGTLYKLEMGILLGSGTSLLIILYRVANPDTTVAANSRNKLQLKGIFSYACAENVRDAVLKIAKINPNLHFIELDFASVLSVDYDFVKMLKRLSVELLNFDIELHIINIDSGTIQSSIAHADLMEVHLNMKETSDENVVHLYETAV